MQESELIKLLIEERNFHNSHPQSVNTKAAFTIASFTTALILFRLKAGDAHTVAWFYFTLLFPSLCLVFTGLRRHTVLHHRQRDILEKQIDQLLSGGMADGTISALRKFNSTADCENAGGLALRIEPENASGLKHHDTQIFVGVGLLFLTAMTIACNAF